MTKTYGGNLEPLTVVRMPSNQVTYVTPDYQLAGSDGLEYLIDDDEEYTILKTAQELALQAAQDYVRNHDKETLVLSKEEAIALRNFLSEHTYPMREQPEIIAIFKELQSKPPTLSLKSPVASTLAVGTAINQTLSFIAR